MHKHDHVPPSNCSAAPEPVQVGGALMLAPPTLSVPAIVTAPSTLSVLLSEDAPPTVNAPVTDASFMNSASLLTTVTPVSGSTVMVLTPPPLLLVEFAAAGRVQPPVVTFSV
jgi:hypothetical protein